MPNFRLYLQSFRRIASEALAAMKVKRYRRHLQAQNFDDSERDTCAVCLDAFHPKQVMIS